ncbi:hypothetical protein MiSe_19920 [Microseira wollei NIES-4236]|uniref:Secreted protein n=1 Tax=Microseira wollei NIES-4236 TaxID=2530354 RepID=A0AAV3WG71_9CYAN|nr:hypothetical protein MiSe_19920 [Microseira wollei NIES-4236]
MVICGLRYGRVCASAFTYVYGAITNGGVGCHDMPEARTRVRTSVKKNYHIYCPIYGNSSPGQIDIWLFLRCHHLA